MSLKKGQVDKSSFLSHHMSSTCSCMHSTIIHLYAYIDHFSKSHCGSFPYHSLPGMVEVVTGLKEHPYGETQEDGILDHRGGTEEQ